MTFYETLELAMRMKGLKPSEVCARAGMHQSYISKLKSGHMRSVEWDKAIALITALDMTPNDFYELQMGNSQTGSLEGTVDVNP